MINRFIPILANTTTEDLDVSSVNTAIDGVVKLSDAIAENGALIVICAVFILIFILIFFLFLRMNNSMLKSVISQIQTKNDETTNITNQLLTHVLEKEEEKQKAAAQDPGDDHAKDLVGMFIDYNITFKNAAKIVLNQLRCDRVAIYVFHNGNKTPYGLPFIKMSCVYELTMKGSTTMRGRAHINLPLHLFNDFVEKLYEHGEFSGNISDVEINDDSMKEFLTYSDAKAIYMSSITKDDGTLAGFTVCEFNKFIDFANRETYMNIMNNVRDMNNSVKYIVTNEDFSKKYESR